MHIYVFIYIYIDEAQCLYESMKGIGTNERCLIQIICSKEPHQIRHLAETYKRCKF